MAYTRAEKEKIIRHFKSEHEKRLQRIRKMVDDKARIYEHRVLRRLNTVSVTLWNVRLKEVLEVERHHKPTIKSLLNDIKALRDDSPFNRGLSASYNSSKS
ncbi:uncharacterized protein PRCAT00002750001 [Priceomyces carsonii]|uniref:uncharacterized protein n=1 Tax=Priceomyces carsonii TaxID=28549 RepID=UPI002ED96A5C|nr:unnamed protein product [Priceomyces carsonii]